jgi:hypothetical protein
MLLPSEAMWQDELSRIIAPGQPEEKKYAKLHLNRKKLVQHLSSQQEQET